MTIELLLFELKLNNRNYSMLLNLLTTEIQYFFH